MVADAICAHMLFWALSQLIDRPHTQRNCVVSRDNRGGVFDRGMSPACTHLTLPQYCLLHFICSRQLLSQIHLTKLQFRLDSSVVHL